MKRLLTFLVFILILTSLVAGQSRKKKRSVPKTIRVTVNVKGNVPPIKPLPNETDEGIWTVFELKDVGLQILLPATPKNIVDDNTGDVRSYEAETKMAKYLVIVRDLGVSLERNGAGRALDAIIDRGFGQPDSKSRIIKRGVLSYEGRPGRELISEEKSKRSISRLYILDGKLFALSVIIDNKDYTADFDKWVSKFFDSFQVKVSAINEA